MTTESQRARLESLLRLAEDPGTTAEERALALERFTALATKLQVDAADVNPHSGQYTREDIVTHTFQVPASYGLSSTRYHGIYRVIEALGASCFLDKTRRMRGNKKPRPVLETDGITVFATESTMQALKMLLPSLFIQEANACAAYIEQTKVNDPYISAVWAALEIAKKARRSAPSFRRDYDKAIKIRRKSFCLAFFVEAAECVKAKREDAVQAAGRGYALAQIDTQDRIRQAMADLDLRDRKPSGWYNADGWEHGTRAGRQAMVGQAELGGGRTALEG